jgi:membrane protein implicated in regulation of membrane protease activity
MWLNAFIYFLAPNLVMIAFGLIGSIVGKSAEAIIGVAWLLFVIAVLLLPPLYASTLYHRHCKKKIAKVRASRLGQKQQLEELSRKGGVSNVVLILVSIFVFIFVVGTLAAVAIPAFHDYKTKARMVGIVLFGNAATDSVAAYYKQHQRMPSTLEESGFILSLPQDIKGVRVNSENGMVILTMAIEPISGKSLMFVPSLDSIEKIEWTCMSQEIQDRYLPQQCWRKK